MTNPMSQADSAAEPWNRIAGAPVSWGVCEVPNWGYQMPAERVLAEMAEVGLSATEFGPDGFLPADPGRMAQLLDAHHLTAVGGFAPVLLHAAAHDPLPEIDRILAGYDATHAEVMVLAAVSGLDGYDSRPTLDDDDWKRLLNNVDRIASRAADHGVLAVLHPHVGTMIETGSEVERILDGSSVALCLDTGHLLIGGTDPAELTRHYAERIAHTHLKDVNNTIAAKVRAGRLTYTEAVAKGMYRPLGTGDVDIATIVNTLQSNNYQGWFVLEQDTMLTEEPTGVGPIQDVRISADYVRSLLAR